ncbi:unnamed protein product [Mytilus edulis]|uniref:Uncharacterized protein n=1 Tax=Mytilus edulis TaxID=6550 RepID=A0A8S3RAL1_MYTED|nr:unnamed protein product [Mytilus edulis]
MAYPQQPPEQAIRIMNLVCFYNFLYLNRKFEQFEEQPSAITGADSKLAGSCSDCNCSALSVLKLFTETIDSQKKEWGCKLAIKLLQNGSGISANITRIRKIGKDALQAGNLHKALEIYTKGIKDCSDEGDLKNEAIMYTNRATVYTKLNQHELALKDAESAILADSSWHKVWKYLVIKVTQHLFYFCSYEADQTFYI